MKILIIILILCSCCSTVKINGTKIKHKENLKLDEKQKFWMLISFLISFGVWEHFSRPVRK